MSLSEFAAIQRYFSDSVLSHPDAGIALGIGDDAAVLSLDAGQQLVVSADTLVEGVHFPAGSAAERIGYRALAVNLSDLAAMGAQPRWYTLCLTLPELEAGWLEGFSRGLADAAAGCGIVLVGGDTTRGPLSVTVQVMGQVAAGTALSRHGAQPGDAVCVTGYLGDAAAALAVLQGNHPGDPGQTLLEAYWRPVPRLREAALLRDIATSCIDISDGLLADLAHICERSGVGARLQLDAIPLSEASTSLFGAQALTYALCGGDDYELCFTLPSASLTRAEQRFAAEGLAFRCIGQVTEGAGVACYDNEGKLVDVKETGYDHFG